MEKFVCSYFFLSFIFLQPFFVERAFRIFDRDKNGTVSMSEFIETMHQFAGQSTDEKLVFLFKVYDLDGKEGKEGALSAMVARWL